MRHGFLLIDKPIGPTSHDAVQVVRRALGERDIGHVGTLDPAASGLLVLAVGAKALKVLEFFNGLPKEYVAKIKFGEVSSTYDREGVIETFDIKPGVPEPDHIQIRRLIDERFVGTISQRPPAHSAVHIDGERAYDKARRGETVEMPERTVRIEACKILTYEYPWLTLNVACGSGTYIRSLAHDVGEMLKCGGYLADLRRTKVGEWHVDDAVEPSAAEWGQIQPLKEILKGMPQVTLNDAEWEHIRHGRPIAQHIQEEVFAWHNDLPVAVLKPVPNGARARKVL